MFICICICVVSNHGNAKDLKKKTMKLISKMALLYDNGKLNEKVFIALNIVTTIQYTIIMTLSTLVAG